MKKTIIAVFLTALAAGNVRAVELEGINLGNLPLSSAAVPANEVPGAIKTDPSWAREAARELRRELNELGIIARVSVTTGNNGQPALLVEFTSNEDYEEISDLFYQDPGAPSYMDVKVVVQIGAAKSESCEETLQRLGNKVADMQVKYRAATLEERVAMRPALEAALTEYAACQVRLLRGERTCAQSSITKATPPAGVYRISCKYNDAYKVNNVARLDMTGTYSVLDKDSATLAYKATLTFVEEQPATVYFAVGESLKNEKYSGINYPDHFKFPLRWHGVSGSIEWGNLIISKQPVSVVKDEYGATVRSFNGALDVSYNDHHGNYVKVTCTDN